MARCGAQAYNGGLEAQPPVGCIGRVPGQGSGGKAPPPEAKNLLAFAAQRTQQMCFILQPPNHVRPPTRLLPSKNSPDLHQCQERPLAKVGWTWGGRPPRGDAPVSDHVGEPHGWVTTQVNYQVNNALCSIAVLLVNVAGLLY